MANHSHQPGRRRRSRSVQNFRPSGDAGAHRVQPDFVGRTEMEKFEFAARENILGHHVIRAEGNVEAGDVFAVADIGERIVAADIDVGR